MQTPDSWIVFKIQTPEETFFKLFSCWYGSFLDGDKWRLNSGITSVTKDDNGFYIVKGNSDTVYKVHKSSYNKCTTYCNGVKESLMGNGEFNIEVIDLDEYLKLL